ncbi:S-adenosyl-L-methionine-dependent methyltransferase [Cucurbitaria berberidis CBS 394.84]|uniref:S-adenosyl-L-methionine-dependent methyltransferase n=1 Tax=Cucurbitaria berberidis CBS 394.84 TaxID=1168544 RepID=A0A9P4L9Z6_9PLEO|nr:S-adenosyl-L-methionine-dependent methyltransferase [Cucurbitaria berberidis CBS 394.84]KAF1846893.1 S-adenosyl-L-methionine-dependent methyltransferase [Cucurbitaria berberidis CBS 394.84]
MAIPTDVNRTFDTSLVDFNVNASFSTTESDPSDYGAVNHATTTKTPDVQPTSLFEEQNQEMPAQSQTSVSPVDIGSAPKPPTSVQHLPTQDTYDQWASIYDTDGNMLQSIDDAELETLLPDFLAPALSSSKSSSTKSAQDTPTLSLLDLGCGTGRNTAKLLSYAWPANLLVEVMGLDFSRGMLDVARTKLRPLMHNSKDKSKEEQNISLRLECTDCFPTISHPSASPLPSVPDGIGLRPVDAVISTLVLEHIPLLPFFATLAALLVPNGLALVTNMHAQMGAVSQAGFVNARGVKVRGSSFAHTVEETVQAAGECGFEVVEVRERAMSREDVECGRVGSRGGKWVGVKVWFGVVVRKVG